MQVTTVSDIITKQVLNELTGELESTSYKQMRETKTIRGGFYMIYKSYDEALLDIVKSNKDLQIVVNIRNKFTSSKSEVELSASDICIHLGTTRQKIHSLLKRMESVKLIRKAGRMSYRLNPFMYIPYHANGSELQADWAR